MRLAYGKERIMVKSAYFTRFGAQDYQIFQLQDKSYVMVRLVDDFEDENLFMLLEHIEGQSGAKCYMLEAPLETALITASDGEYGDDQSVAEIIGHGRLVHNIHVRRILHHNRFGL